MYNNYNCGRKGTFSRDKIIYKIERNDYFSLSLSLVPGHFKHFKYYPLKS